ncbi:Crp/Fnr family transcriptional regulator [Sphingomonas xinjiangensis]|uniref:CRP-like cAMP-binding protein n=1 Tax=Sphingomonas xinjiangensis TaxID=643568 RepID=A0A840YHS2_9SPHN|nr:Crp/Fnr family transcriptional regulator [Sphingomonas xinjiangensis]MBB5711925.1 CRP-like cAMP-binding protein [Sphingomonas xinjiangensis]
MNIAYRSGFAFSAVVTRLSRLAALSDADRNGLRDAESLRCRIGAHREITESQFDGRPLLLVAGWAARVRIFSDGRRQLLSLLLPGDVIAAARPDAPAAPVTALTEVTVAPAPTAAPGSPLDRAYAAAAAAEQTHLYRQIARLGRLSAYERLADWLLEVQERLAAADLVNGTGFPMPLTQEVLADTLGLTSVHINRTLQSMRRDGVLDLRSGTARLPDAQHLASLVDYRAS